MLARIQHLHGRLRRRLDQTLERARQRADHASLRLQAGHPRRRLERGHERAAGLLRRLRAAQAARLARRQTALDALARRLAAQAPALRLQRLRQRLVLLGNRQHTALRRGLQARLGLLRELGRGLHTVSPLATLGRGYAILQRENGQAVRAAADVVAGEPLEARLAEGRLRLRVDGANQ
jgi:exodeoxyribonuclease VII large subunit